MTAYKILSIESEPYPSVSILIEAETNREQLESIAKHIAVKHKVKHVGFLDYAELQEYAGYTLGHWSNDVSNIKEKDWSQRPSQEEVDTYIFWQETHRDLRQDSKGGHLHIVVEEDESIEVTANRLSKTNEEVQEAIERVIYWIP